jgi:hypothetical protein
MGSGDKFILKFFVNVFGIVDIILLRTRSRIGNSLLDFSLHLQRPSPEKSLGYIIALQSCRLRRNQKGEPMAYGQRRTSHPELNRRSQTFNNPLHTARNSHEMTSTSILKSLFPLYCTGYVS